MSAWQGGYDQRGPQHGPKYGWCPACREPIHNRGAHAEACPGPIVPACGHLVAPAFSFGVRVGCRLPQGHRGPHE